MQMFELNSQTPTGNVLKVLEIITLARCVDKDMYTSW